MRMNSRMAGFNQRSRLYRKYENTLTSRSCTGISASSPLFRYLTAAYLGMKEAPKPPRSTLMTPPTEPSTRARSTSSPRCCSCFSSRVL